MRYNIFKLASKDFYFHNISGFAAPLLMIQGAKGTLACGYLNINTANKIGDTIAIVTNVHNYDDMYKSKIIDLSIEAKKLGITIGDSGYSALNKFK